LHIFYEGTAVPFKSQGPDGRWSGSGYEYDKIILYNDYTSTAITVKIFCSLRRYRSTWTMNRTAKLRI